MSSVEPDEAFLSVITPRRKSVAESNFTAAKMPKRRGALERWLFGLEFPLRRTECCRLTAAIADRLGVGCRPINHYTVSDGLIAATGLEHKLTVVTRNIEDFQRSGGQQPKSFHLVHPLRERWASSSVVYDSGCPNRLAICPIGASCRIDP